MTFNRKIKRQWWYKLIFKPDIYLKALLVSAFGVGIITTILIFLFGGGHTETIPPAFHSILGVVLGLLLVFRTNTAYDRWWKGREYLSNIEANYTYMKSKIETTSMLSNQRKMIEMMVDSLDLLQAFLIKEDHMETKTQFLKQIHLLFIEDKRNNYGIETVLKEVIDNFNSLERIRDTPIPQSYSLHIKVSILLYFLTLPFGILYEMGYLSIVLVMILYYVVAGIEIISNEIENPFTGDPNDLPVETYIASLKRQLLITY